MIKGMGGMGVDDVEANSTAEKTRKHKKSVAWMLN